MTKPTTKEGSIRRVQGLFDDNNVSYTTTSLGREIKIKSPAGIIKIHHNGRYHWTMRVPGMASVDIRFGFGVNMTVDSINHLIMFDDVMAIKYEN